VSFAHKAVVHTYTSINLEDMGITDGADRLKILQQITSMRADLMTSGCASPARRLRKGRHLSSSTQYPMSGHGCWGQRYHANKSDAQGMKQAPRQTRYVNLNVQEDSPRTSISGASQLNSPSQLSTDQTSSDSQLSSRMSTPEKYLQARDILSKCSGMG